MRRSLMRRLARDETGVSAVEFALIAPVMILFYAGMVDLCQGYMAVRRTSHVAASVADLTAQSRDITKADIDKVLNFEVPDSLLVERVTGRLVHPASGRSYHEKFAPPKKPMTDDITGEPLTRRKDDNAETLKNRLASFHKSTKPVVDYYAKQGLYSPIDANQKSDKVKGIVAAILEK